MLTGWAAGFSRRPVISHLDSANEEKVAGPKALSKTPEWKVSFGEAIEAPVDHRRKVGRVQEVEHGETASGRHRR